MPVDLQKKTWLSDLVSAILADYDPAAALLRLPPELRGADPEGPDLEARARTLLVRSLRRRLLDSSATASDDPFVGPIEDHVRLLLDIALLHGAPFDPPRRRAEVASFLAALVGGFDVARAAQPTPDGPADPDLVLKAFIRAGAALRARNDPPGDPKDGLPLRVGALCIQRRHLARIAISFYGEGHLDLAGARGLAEQAGADVVLLVEALAVTAAAAGRLDARRRRIALAQVGQLGLPRELARDAREGIRDPRTPAELAAACPVRLRAFLLEQLLLAELASGNTTPAAGAAVQAFADEARIPPEQVTAIAADAAELLASHQRWLDPGPAQEEWSALAEEWDEVADQMMDKVSAVLADNLDAIVTEVKQTGELGQLLAKAASGKTLDADEKRKVKAQLIDLAKAVPALAIFAAPGGMLLLPLLAKLLPFSVLPSAWDEKDKARDGKRPRARRRAS